MPTYSVFDGLKVRTTSRRRYIVVAATKQRAFLIRRSDSKQTAITEALHYYRAYHVPTIVIDQITGAAVWQ